MPSYTVKQGDCIASIAFQFRMPPTTIWNHSKNSDLKNTRPDPYVLFPGDVVFVPEKEPRIEERPTDARHLFTVNYMPEVLSLRFLRDNEPSAGVPYTLVIDGRLAPAGTLNSEGACKIVISPGSKHGTITLGDPNDDEVYQLLLGHLDPVEEFSGVQWRLSNLGYFLPTDDAGEESPEFQDAIRAFQEDQELPTENGLDEITRQKLMEVHGS
jgi:hypothetical protein